jgi:hypothetical protein
MTTIQLFSKIQPLTRDNTILLGHRLMVMAAALMVPLLLLTQTIIKM